MGFTPLEGLMMATRSGSIDPAVVTYVEQRHGLKPDQVDEALNRQSGLLGVSGISGDMREVLKAVREGNERAQLAFASYTRRIRQAIGAFTVTMGGIDALVFTAGVGENAREVRASVCDGLECLGLVLDPRANFERHPDADLAATGSPARILVIATREEQAMFQEVKRVMSSSSNSAIGRTNEGTK
jgi:acetate kinase